MPILRQFFTPYLQPAPVQLLQKLQLPQQQNPQQQNAYESFFQPQPTGQPDSTQSQYEQTPFNTAANLQEQYNAVQQSRQNQFQPQPLLNDPVAATQTNPITNFVQTSAARPSFQEYFNQLNTISATGADATQTAQDQAATKQQGLLASINSSSPALGTFSSNDRVKTAQSLIGVPYVWGAEDKNGTDCSGLVYQVLNASGTKVPRLTAAEYGRMGRSVALAEAQPGDVVYFDHPGATDHVGIYIGNGQMIDAPFTGARVRIDRIGKYTSIRRIGEVSAGMGATSTPKGFNAASNRSLGQQLLAQKGWAGQWNAFDNLVSHESGWNNTAQNPRSTAYGLGQFLNSTWGSYGQKTSDPRLQLLYMLDYIRGRYGDPNRAWQFWQKNRWY